MALGGVEKFFEEWNNASDEEDGSTPPGREEEMSDGEADADGRPGADADGRAGADVAADGDADAERRTSADAAADGDAGADG